MFKLVLQKMWNKKWMVLSLLLGNILLIGVVTAGPMYAEAMMQKALDSSLNQHLVTENEYSGLVTMEKSVYYVGHSSRRNESGEIVKTQQSGYINRDAVENIETMVPAMPEVFGVPQKYAISSYYTHKIQLEAVDAKDSKAVEVGFLSDLDQHIELISGEPASPEPDADGVVEAVVSKQTMLSLNLTLGRVYEAQDFLDQNGNPVKVRVTGVFEHIEGDDLYWVKSPSSYSKRLFVSEQNYRSYFMAFNGPQYRMECKWYLLLDAEQMDGRMVPAMLSTLAQYQNKFAQMGSAREIQASFEQSFLDYQAQAKRLDVTMWVLQAPIFIVVAVFIFMVSRQMLELERNEIAVFKSRGASKRQIILIYLIQSGVIAVVSYGVGLLLGLLLCQVLGGSNAFLEFVGRSPLPVSINAKALLFGLCGMAGSIATMVLPVFRFASVSIVDHKRSKQKEGARPWWQRFFVDLILLAISLYGLFSFHQQQEVLAARVAAGGSLDPLLYFYSSLFIIGAGLLALRIFPLLVKLVFRLGKKRWKPALYVSFQRILRTRNAQGFIMIFLILTIALGTFDAMTARTVNANAENRIRHAVGADLVLQEKWRDNSVAVTMDQTGNLSLTYQEPDFSKYAALEEAQSVTKVLVDDDASVSLQNGSSVKNVRLMGIHTKEFGQTAQFDLALLPTHWYHYLNAMSQDAKGVLVSQNLQDEQGYQLGDVINYRTGDNIQTQGVIYGFVDYWPTYSPTTGTVDENGNLQQRNNYLVVAHLQQLQSVSGVTPYQVWMKTNGSSQFIYDFAEETGTNFEVFEDTSAQLIAIKNDAIFQATNGALTVGFIVVLLLCAAGFLIYWVLSIRSRTLQFGIFRAMGMSMKEILQMLLNEQLFISGLSILLGALVGTVASQLFVPLIQVAYASFEQAVPLQVVSSAADSVRLFTVVGLMIILCMVVLGTIIKKIKISQALKLGEE